MRHNIESGDPESRMPSSYPVEERRRVYGALAPSPATPCAAAADNPWTTLEGARSRCADFAAGQRFPYFRLALSVAATPQHPLRNVEITTFPAAWLDHYVRQGYVRFDPTLAPLRTTLAPFAWHELARHGAEMEAFFAEAAAHGLVDGFTVPLRGGNGEAAVLTLAGRRVPIGVDARRRLYEATYTFLCAAFDPLRALVARESRDGAAEPLTDKQRQIMILLMQGLGVKSIARRLNIHSRTVDDGLRRACARLGARSREQAIVRALELRQIDLSACAASSTLAQRPPLR